MIRVLLLSLLTLLPAARASAEGPAPAPIRILTYNIHHGEGVDGKLDLQRIARVIDESEADLVALQEVDVKTRRSGGVDQAAELARLTKMHAHFARAMDFGGGQYGVAVLSKHEIVKTRSHALPNDAGAEPRAAAEITVKIGGAMLTLVSTHLDHRSDALRMRQWETLAKALSEVRGPAVLAGDLNDTPESKLIAAIKKEWTDATAKPGEPTIPAEKPRQKIDFVFISPAAKFKIIESKVIEEKVASDHRPVLAVVEVVP